MNSKSSILPMLLLLVRGQGAGSLSMLQTLVKSSMSVNLSMLPILVKGPGCQEAGCQNIERETNQKTPNRIYYRKKIINWY